MSSDTSTETPTGTSYTTGTEPPKAAKSTRSDGGGWVLPTLLAVGGLIVTGAMAESKTHVVSRNSKKLGRSVGRGAREGADWLGHATSDVRESAGSWASDKADSLRSLARHAVDWASDEAHSQSKRARRAGHGLADWARDHGHDARDAAEQFYAGAKSRGQQLRRRVTREPEPETSSITQATEVGAALLGIGLAGAYLFDATHGAARRARLRNTVRGVFGLEKTPERKPRSENKPV